MRQERKCVCVRETESVWMRVRERERVQRSLLERQRAHTCVCVHVCVSAARERDGKRGREMGERKSEKNE